VVAAVRSCVGGNVQPEEPAIDGTFGSPVAVCGGALLGTCHAQPQPRRIRPPVLAMTGLKDIQVDPDGIVSIAAMLSSGQTHVLPDVDHILRHEPRPASDVRRYKRQAPMPIDLSVGRPLLDWLARFPQRATGATG